MKRFISLVTFIFIVFIAISGNILRVGSNQTYSSLPQVVSHVAPGDTILIHQEIYEGRGTFTDLTGEPDKFITIKSVPGHTVIFRGGSSAFHIKSASFLQIQGLVFEQQTGNGLNIDDNGNYDTPSHHIRIENCTFKDINASGNNDLLKMSRVEDFVILNCTSSNGAKGGSGLDMVGCHRGLIQACYFENQGSNAVQAKGGSQHIRIENNVFKNCGGRTLNLGGSTGLDFFSPKDATFEAADLQVYFNTIIGSMDAIAYVGCQRVEVAHNTIIDPEKWVIRILQETVNPQDRFEKCGNNSFTNNVICKGNKVAIDCNIGSNTTPETFVFSGNIWYNYDDPEWKEPVGIPVNPTLQP